MDQFSNKFLNVKRKISNTIVIRMEATRFLEKTWFLILKITTFFLTLTKIFLYYATALPGW